MVSGLDIRYDLDGPDHPLLGARLPDAELTMDGRRQWVSALFHPGRGVLLGTDPRPVGVARPWSERVSATVVPEPPGPDAETALVRPDGYVCWAAASLDAAGLETALRTWFGA